MDALMVLSNALLAGAAAAAKPMAERAITDAYHGLTNLFTRKWGSVLPPAATADREAVTQAIERTEAPKDAEVLRAAQDVLTAIGAHDPAAGAAFGIHVSDLKAGGSIAIEDLLADSGPITISSVSAGKNIRIKGVGNPRSR